MSKIQEQSDELLRQIKLNIAEVEKFNKLFNGTEEDYVYRFYHQSFKVFNINGLIEDAKTLFEKIAPEGVQLNAWYLQIVNEALSKDFDNETTNSNWLTETRPILEAFWHTKYFLNQMVIFGKDLDESPNLLPSGWASILYLYNLRY